MLAGRWNPKWQQHTPSPVSYLDCACIPGSLVLGNFANDVQLHCEPRNPLQPPDDLKQSVFPCLNMRSSHTASLAVLSAIGHFALQAQPSQDRNPH